ncbi:MAG: transcriptional regulator [Naasia sp.]|jgi:FdrA protein|uniref:acyl-CoA synthetase FdrA n=1 Tax=Naasia sp. TaxID=2546198 RepID=UPI00261426DC|nr:acyl-CoA synthetase FdrA [Naasia sp.]MCU1571395.1 transcriptional regulator [Naasia sp.]
MTKNESANSVLSARLLPHLYRDSVALMRIASATEKRDGILRVGAVMATPANLGILADSGMLPGDLAASPDDLVFVVRGVDEQAVEDALDAAHGLLTVSETSAGAAAEQRPGTLREGIAAGEDAPATLAAISVSGTYAPIVAEQALRNGLHVFCFSDNVSVEDEVRLKRLALEQGLLMMGPDCGTAILDGVPLGFANVVRPGSVGIVAASGTGAQEISRLVHSAGGGVSQLIGVGGRDLSAEVDGMMTGLALDLLAEDVLTSVIVVVSKPPSSSVADRLIERLAATGKPAVACFLGLEDSDSATTGVRIRGTLEAGAIAACELDGHPLEFDDQRSDAVAEAVGGVLGLYTGGTLASEAKLILSRAGVRAEILDLGDDQYTAGKPHPMIDPVGRADRIAAAGYDPEVGVILIDLVLGFGAADDPATPVAEAVAVARERAAADGRALTVIGSVCGTEGDPQGLSRQRAILASAGVLLCPTNASAARLALASTSKENS